jgi:hypothetical protein
MLHLHGLWLGHFRKGLDADILWFWSDDWFSPLSGHRAIDSACGVKLGRASAVQRIGRLGRGILSERATSESALLLALIGWNHEPARLPQLDFDRIPWCCTMTSSVCIGWWTLPRFVFNKRHRLGEDYLDLFLRQGRLQIQKLAS